MWRGFPNTGVRVIVAAGLVTMAFLAFPPMLFAQNYGDKISIPSLTLPGDLLPTVAEKSQGMPASVWGYLRLPSESTEHFPAVILVHGCGGVEPNTEGWVTQLNRINIATFVLDSFTGRGIREICTGRQLMNTDSMLVDVYTALALLVSHPRIDPQRIALMGFSYGGRVVLWASLIRFQRTWMTSQGNQFAAYLAFYPASCYIHLFNEDQVVDRPIRIFHGSADDYTPINQCRRYVDRMRQAGRDISLIEYPGAYHGFDSPDTMLHSNPMALNPGTCELVEQADGRWVDNVGRPIPDRGYYIALNSCATRGTHGGGNADARHKAVEDVTAFLRQLFKLGQ